MQKTMLMLMLPLVFGAAQLFAQKTFVGTAEYTFSIKGENAEMMKMFIPEKMVVVYGEKDMLTYIVGSMMQEAMGKVVVNGREQEVFVVKESEKAIYLMDEEDLKNPLQDQKPEVTKLDEQEEIMGYRCQKYQVVTTSPEGQSMTQYIWTTDQLKIPEIDIEGIENLNNSFTSANLAPGFPLKSVTETPGMPMTIELVVTTLNTTTPDPSLFDRPEGFEVKEFDASKMGGN